MLWTVQVRGGLVADLHALSIEPIRSVTFCEPLDACLVLGAGQAESVLDEMALRRRGAGWCRRRSGGGAVWVTPTNQLWLTVTIPRADPLWTEDVNSAAIWLGERLADALGPSVVGEAEVHRGPFSADARGKLVCFASRGTGEVFVGGRKVAAISVKRGLQAAAFHVSIVREPDVGVYTELLGRALRGEETSDRSGAEGTGVTARNLSADDAASLLRVELGKRIGAVILSDDQLAELRGRLISTITDSRS